MSDDLLPEEALVLELEKLRKKLNRSGVERTSGLLDALGPGCEFYWKSLRVFRERDYKEIRSLLLSIYELLENQ